MQLVTTRNARFQQWQSLLTNRAKRTRAGQLVVQGVRPISLAVEHGWRLHALVVDAEREPSAWLAELLARTGAGTSGRVAHVAMAPELLAELGEKVEGPPEAVAVVEAPPDDLARIPVRPDLLAVALDRPSSPGNVGSIVRSADALGAHGLVVSGHAADLYDPKAVRASTGSLFALPSVRVPAAADVLAWVAEQRERGTPVVVAGTDEDGDRHVFDVDLTGPTLLVVGNETTGLSRAWREACDVLVSIPMAGSASSLNAANAATAVLYEAARQRLARSGGAASHASR